MADSKYTAPNDFRAFCEMLGETENSMSHHGIKGQKWGERRFQNPDGTLTAEGRKHYGHLADKKSFAKKFRALTYFAGHLGEDLNAANTWRESKKYANRIEIEKAIKKDEKQRLKETTTFAEGNKGKTKKEIEERSKENAIKTLDGKTRGFDEPIRLNQKSNLYSTSLKSKNGEKVTIYVDSDQTNLEQKLKTAKHVATNETFMKELKTKKELLLNDTDEKNADSLMKTGYISWVDVNKDGATGSYGLRGYKTNGDKEYMEGRFITTPNGKIIPLDPYITDPD